MADLEGISQERAVAIATQDAGESLGTWVDASAYESYWLVWAHSKSVQPPALYIIDRSNGNIIYKSMDADNPRVRNSDHTTIGGKAKNVHGYAAVVTDTNLHWHVQGLDSWPSSYLDKRVAVTGTLAISVGTTGQQLVIENAKWALTEKRANKQ